MLCLYASDLEDDKLQRQYYIIPLIDNQNLLEAKEEDDVLTYATAKRFDEKFNVWKDTYHSEAFTIGFFEEDIQPFHFGRKNYSINDLKEITHTDIQKKYHQFATILRKYNVSGRENAFDKLVNLFLCKLVDEQEHKTNLSFYWKGRAYDDDFQLQDRLQQLYQHGMKLFLHEDVTYINQEQIDEAFRFLEKDNDPDATKETINRYFKQLKFFTNNDFAFIDVHNERLFAENANVLRSIVEMLQDIKLKSESEEHSNQFLGDMFEGFLDAGVKQSEGQFFTPMPIVKFIINSLPLEEIIVKNEQPPKAIDYACGAGHFLTELARQLKPLVDQFKKANVTEYYRNITGIEKEYRLSKVAKVSTFMYGQDQINIIYADALAKNNELQNGTYNILVANPPYSVKGFLETLKHTDRKAFELFGIIDEKAIITNNSIETFFIERAKQLLAPDGVAAIILPSSVLSNDAQLYRQARQILLQHFHIIAIAELGSGTFGKTGTNTVTLFLKRRKQNPSEAEHYLYRSECWIMGGEVGPRAKKNKEYNDLHLLESYCKHIDVAYNDYKYFLQEEEPNEALKQTEFWKEYERAFYDRADIKAHQRKPYFKKLSEKQQKAELNEMLCRYVRKIEQEKLYYYLLAQSNAVPVLVIKSPADNKAMKKFLGYEWSSAKGNEGIKYLNAASLPEEGEDEPKLVTAQLNSIQTPLYNPVNKLDPEKLNNYIIDNFLGKSFTIPQSLSEHAQTIRLENMIDFSRKDFTKSILLSAKKVAEVKSKWDVKLLSQIGFVSRGASPRPIASYLTNGKDGIPWIKIGDAKVGDKYITSTAEKITIAGAELSKKVKKGDFIISNSMSIGRPFILKIDGCIHDGWLLISSIDQNVSKEYLYEILNSEEVQLQFKGIALGGVVQNLNISRASDIKIPVPPKQIQEKIVEECNAVDQAIAGAQQTIDSANKAIEKKIVEVQNNYRLLSLHTVVKTNPSKSEIKDLEDDLMVSFVEMASVSNDGYIETSEIKPLKSLRKGSYTYFAEDDVIVAKITPCMENGKCALAKSLSNAIGMGSSEFHVFRPKEEMLSAFLFYQLNRESVRKEAERNMTGSSGHRRVPISFYENLKIAVPPISDQQDIVSEIEIFQAQIATAKKTIEDAATQKQAILKKWLE